MLNYNLLHHQRRDPADLALVGDHQERRVPDEIISEMSRHVIEEKDVRRPDLAGRELQPGQTAVLLGLPLEVVVLPGQVQPDEGGEDTLQQSVLPTHSPPLPSPLTLRGSTSMIFCRLASISTLCTC